MTIQSTELAKRQVAHIEATPALPGIGAKLDEFMRVHTISSTPFTDLMTGRRGELLRIDGIIKPDLEAVDAVALRYEFLVSFEAIVMILETAGGAMVAASRAAYQRQSTHRERRLPVVPRDRSEHRPGVAGLALEPRRPG